MRKKLDELMRKRANAPDEKKHIYDKSIQDLKLEIEMLEDERKRFQQT